MPIRHIGREGTYKGKFLFHLLCNLKSFGVGRMVVRKSFNERYPEPSYYIIKKACPDLTSEVHRYSICNFGFSLNGSLMNHVMKEYVAYMLAIP